MCQISHHTYQSFGGWPYYYWDYWNKGLMGRLDNNETQALWDLVDPYSKLAPAPRDNSIKLEAFQ